MASETDQSHGQDLAPADAPAMTGSGRFGPGRQMARLIARRPRLFGFVVAVVVARIILSVLAATEQPDGVFPFIITVAMVLEVVLVWRAVHGIRGEDRMADRGPSTGVDRTLCLIERFGAPVVYATTAACVAAFVVLHLQGASKASLVGTIDGVRWVQFVVLIGTVLLARRWEATVAAEPATGR